MNKKTISILGCGWLGSPLAGLVGPGRALRRIIPSRSSKRNRPLNLIHRDDCVEILTRIIERDIRGEVFNAVYDQHPSGCQVFSKQTSRLARPSVKGKIVSNKKLKERLNYRFKFPDPILWAKNP